MWSEEDLAELSQESDNEANEQHREVCVIEDPEVWMDYFSEELLDLWYSLKEQCTSRGFAILDTCLFPDFAQFCFQFSSGYPPPV